MTSKGYSVSFKGDENVLKLDHDAACTALTILKTTETVHVK